MTIFASALLLSAHLNGIHLSETIKKVDFFPQIAGSYRGSYFSKVGLLITEIAAAPTLPSSFVSLHADYRNRCRS